MNTPPQRGGVRGGEERPEQGFICFSQLFTPPRRLNVSFGDHPPLEGRVHLVALCNLKMLSPTSA